MTSKNLKEMILYSLEKHHNNSGLATYVIKNWVNYDFKKKIETSKILYQLKQLEKEKIVIRVPSLYKVQLVWKMCK